MVMEAQDTAIKPGYKLTEVGVIPKDWGISTVGAEFEVQLGKMLDLEKNKGLLKNYIGNKAVQWGHIDISDLQTMAMSRSDLARFRLRCGDLLVCEGGEVGRAAIWEAPIEECYYQKALHRLRPLRGFNTHLMLALLQYWTTYGKLTDYVSQTSIAHLTRENFIEVQMPVPDADEQRAIATALSDVDALITSLDKLIAKKRNIKQATMQQLLTGKTRLPGFSGHGSAKLGDFFELNPGKIHLNNTDLVTFIGMEDISENGYVINQNVMPLSSIKKGLTFFERNDVLVAKITPCFENGKGACLDTLETKSGFGSTEFHVLRAKKNSIPRYIFYQTQTMEFRKQLETEMIGTAGQKRVSAQAIINYVLPVLHLKDEQQAIASVLTNMDAEIAALEHKREKTHMLKQGMMQELLTGKTRLV